MDGVEPHLPKKQPGARRVDDWRVISGILHVIRTGCPWRQCPSEFGPHSTIYNQFNRWSGKGHWKRIMEALGAGNWIAETGAMDASYVKAHRSAHGGNGGRAQTIGRSRGGQTTTIHALTDILGRPVALTLSG